MGGFLWSCSKASLKLHSIQKNYGYHISRVSYLQTDKSVHLVLPSLRLVPMKQPNLSCMVILSIYERALFYDMLQDDVGHKIDVHLFLDGYSETSWNQILQLLRHMYDIVEVSNINRYRETFIKLLSDSTASQAHVWYSGSFKYKQI